ncbi:protein-export chaperone SecB [Clostridium sulfidigenes]|uniref:protein-export chaperone SecB n=1 Tax=Clostridium sulfidigenes TaxID=318464 RepID=UPI003F891B73
MFSGVLKFNGYNVEKFNYIRNNSKDTNSNEPVSLSPQIMFKIVLKKDNPLKSNVLIGVRLGYEDNALPFKVEAVVRGYFELEGEETTELDSIYKFYLQNGTAILYPYLRAIVTTLTGTGNYQAIILPTVNFYKLIENSDLEEISLPNEMYEEFYE